LTSTRAPWIRQLPLIGYLALSIAVGAAILILCEGHLVYSLDDPYIHMALARNLWAGHYGLNLQEFSAPASSILWPLLLAPFTPVGGLELAPLAINIACAAGLLTFLMRVAGPDLGVADAMTAALLGCLAVLLFNLVGLTFTGMEHVLQVLVSVLIVVGLIRFLDRGAAPWWFVAALALAPLVRYESLALTAPALAVLWLRGRRGLALAVFGFVAVTLGAFSWYLVSLGLEPLPSSVLAKSATLSQSSMGRGSAAVLQLLRNVRDNLLSLTGVLLGLLVTLQILGARRQPASTMRWLLGWLGATLTLHLLFGRHGWFERYEIYVVAPCALLAVRAWGDVLRLPPPPGRRLQAVAVAMVLLLSVRFVRATALTPLAAANTYEQQYQMARFVRDHLKERVAINDLGLVAWFNPQLYVLDLAGLASIDALRAPRRTESAWITRLTDRYGVRFAMIYATWYPKKPCDWVEAGTLTLGRTRITASEPTVTFYGVGSDNAAIMRERLGGFGATLPPRARLALAPPVDATAVTAACAASPAR
jgi:hypothetical protein